jgi:hypothetical protein
MILDGATRTGLVKWKLADVGERTLYIEARTWTFAGDDGKLGGLVVSPLAVLVKERGREYSIPLEGADADGFTHLLETLL